MPSPGSDPAAESPAFPPSMHRLGAVAHKSSTCLCTDSREAGFLPAGRQQRIGTGPGPACPASAPRARSRDTLVHRPPLPGKDGRPPLPGSRRPQVGAKSRVRLRLVGTDMIKVLANRKPHALQMAAEFYAIYRVLRAFLLLTPSISVRCGPTVNRRLLKFNAPRLMWQAGKRCYRRRSRRR